MTPRKLLGTTNVSLTIELIASYSSELRAQAVHSLARESALCRYAAQVDEISDSQFWF